MADGSELIDIYDASLRPLGQKERLRAHMDGDWHRTFHCWVLRATEDPAMLFQLRANSMADSPNKWDVSAAGHIMAGETVADGAREVREELGLEFDFSTLIYAGDRVEVADDKNGMRNREYQSVHFLPTRLTLEEFNPQLNEVAGLLWMRLDDGTALFSGSVDFVACAALLFKKDQRVVTELSISTGDFVPRIQRYYLASIISGERVLRGELPIAVS